MSANRVLLLSPLSEHRHTSSMKLPPNEYSTESAKRRLVAAEAKEPAEYVEPTEKREAVQVNKLFRSRLPQTRIYARKGGDVSVGTIGVSNLEDLQDLMSRYDSFNKLMEDTQLKSRQAIHSALKDASEALSRAKENGVPVTRQIQFLVNAINRCPDPMAQLCRFLLKMAPEQDRRTMAALMSIYLQIPLDELVKLKAE